MNTKAKTYTKEQHELIAELCATYGLESDQIVFFSDDPEPLFDRDATAVLIHKLTDAVGIADELVAAPYTDAIAVQYTITFKDGTFAGSTGVANLNEKRDGQPMSRQEIQSLATSRASRSALRNKGINLLKLHNQRKAGNVAAPEFSGQPLTERQRLLREVHALGTETGYILPDRGIADGKIAWRGILRTRYAAETSQDLSDTELRDFAAFLRSTLPATKAAA